MSNDVDLERVWQVKKRRILALAKGTAEEAAQKAKELQGTGQLNRGSREGLPTFAIGWVNRTERAADKIVGRAFNQGSAIIVELFNTVYYAQYLELANNRKYELLHPVLMSFKERYLKEVQDVMDADDKAVSKQIKNKGT
jgi:hypothetical protein